MDWFKKSEEVKEESRIILEAKVLSLEAKVNLFKNEIDWWREQCTQVSKQRDSAYEILNKFLREKKP